MPKINAKQPEPPDPVEEVEMVNAMLIFAEEYDQEADDVDVAEMWIFLITNEENIDEHDC